MTLTDEERRKFSAYCRHEAMSYDGLAKAAANLPGGEMMALPMRRNAAAYAFVARHLGSVETQTVDAPNDIGEGNKS